MSLASGVSALATRVAQEFNTLRTSLASSLAAKADDSTVVHLSGAETIAGTKTVTGGLLVPTPGSPGNPVRNDDVRNSDARTPLAGSVVNASVAGGAAIEETKLALASDAAAGVASRRTLGTGAQQAAAGNDPRIVGAAADSAVVHNTGAESITGYKLFTQGIGVAAPSQANSAVRNDDPRLSAAAAAPTGTVNVKDYGAVGDGSTNDTAAIQATIAACPAGGRVWFPPGVYTITAPLVLPPGVTFEGAHTQTLNYTGALAAPCSIRPSAGFTGPAAVRLLDKVTGGYATDNVGSRMRNIHIDGSAAPAGACIGVQVVGLVREATFENVTVYQAKGNGFDVAPQTTGGTVYQPMSLRFRGCVAHGATGAGFSMKCPDSTWIDCNSIGSGWVGYLLAGCQNGEMVACRAEWAVQHGFAIMYGDWGSGTGSGGMSLTGCTTDRNGQNGVYVSGTGTAAVQLTGCTHRRDGRNNGGGGGGFAAVFVDSAATMPVTIANVTVFPGVDDDGTKTLSPQYGVSATGTDPVMVASGYIHAATAAVNGGAALVVDPEVGTATGSTAAPTRVAPAASVPVTQRGPIGGVATYNVAAGSWVIPGGVPGALEQQWTITGDITCASVSDGINGQPILLWFYASGAQRVVTFAAAFEVTQPVPGRVLTIPSGTWGSALVKMRGSTPVLMAAYPQPVEAPCFFQGRATAAQTLPATGTNYSVNLQAEDYDTDNGHSTGTNPSRWVCQRAGTYQIDGVVAYNTGSGIRGAQLNRNGSVVPGSYNQMPASSASLNVVTPQPVWIDLTVGDYIELVTAQTQAANVSTYYSTTVTSMLRVRSLILT